MLSRTNAATRWPATSATGNAASSASTATSAGWHRHVEEVQGVGQGGFPVPGSALCAAARPGPAAPGLGGPAEPGGYLDRLSSAVPKAG